MDTGFLCGDRADPEIRRQLRRRDQMKYFKPERDGRASLLAFIATLDASARSLRRKTGGVYGGPRMDFGRVQSDGHLRAIGNTFREKT
jgi:hypothetical protein